MMIAYCMDCRRAVDIGDSYDVDMTIAPSGELHEEETMICPICDNDNVIWPDEEEGYNT